MNPPCTTGTDERTAVADEEVAAFVPHPLPPAEPALELNGTIEKQLRNAEEALRRLELAGEMVPSLDWFIYGFARKEAVVSSQIEGTQATLVNLLTLRRSPLKGLRRMPISGRCATTWKP